MIVTRVLAGSLAAVTLAFGVMVWLHDVRTDQRDEARAEVIEVRGKLDEARKEIRALDLAAEMDHQESVAGFEDTRRSCEGQIRSTVRAMRVAPVNPTPKVIPDVDQPQACPRVVCDCPSFRVRDLQAAGADHGGQDVPR